MSIKVTYSLKNYSEIELAEIAKLSVDVWNAKGNQYNVERFTNWLKNLEFTIEPKIILARKGNLLVGWSMLFAHSKTELQFNPFALGGHPIISLTENRNELSNALLRKAIEFFNQSNFTRIDLTFNEKKSKEEQFFKEIYDLNNFVLTEQICHMRINLDNYQQHESKIGDKKEILPISQVDKEEFFDCLSITFRDTEDRWMNSLTDDEMRDFFENRVLNISFKLIEDSSIGIFENGKLIGFSVVRESHGEQNGNLWIMGVHPASRKQGLGTFLLDSMLNNLAKNEYKTASLNVDLTNKPAFDLYKKKGFKKDWIQLAYVLKKGE